MILIFWTVFPELKLNWLTMFSHMYFVCLINEEILAFEVNLLFFGWLFWFLNVSTFFFWNWAINYWNWTYPYSVFTNFHVQFSNHYKTQHLKLHSHNLYKHFATFLAFSIKFWLKMKTKRISYQSIGGRSPTSELEHFEQWQVPLFLCYCFRNLI